MKSSTIATLALGAALILGVAVILATNRHASPSPIASNDSVEVKATNNPGNEQELEITAKGGYTPRTARAKAGEPLLLKIKTDGTFDCSAQLRIPGIGWSQNLPPTGEALVQVPAQRAGTTLAGVCSMGMLNFKITFE
jgi:plastocyanin domain-containing protein